MRARVRGGDGREQHHDFVVQRSLPPPHEDPEAMPLSFAIVPRETGSGDFEVLVEGFASATAPAPLVSRRAITGFISGRTLVLPMPLLEVCAPVTCPAEQTCVDGACEDPHVPPETLRPVEQPGGELDMDGGRRLDAATPDGGPRDAGTCLFEMPTMALDVGAEDWDPTVTEDGTYMVFSDGELKYATRPSGTGDWAYGGVLDIEGVDDPSAPVISPDGNAIIVSGTPTGGGELTLYELARSGPSAPFMDPVPILDMKPDVAEPGLDRSWTVLVGTLGTELVEARRSATGTRFDMGVRVGELAPYSPRFPALSGDGHVVAFARLVDGDDDIYLAQRTSLATGFATPPVAFPFNTSEAEHDPWITYDFDELYFARQRADGNWDLWVSALTCE